MVAEERVNRVRGPCPQPSQQIHDPAAVWTLTNHVAQDNQVRAIVGHRRVLLIQDAGRSDSMLKLWDNGPWDVHGANH